MVGVVPWEECEGDRKMPEQGLWAAVIMQAFNDAKRNSNKPDDKLAKVQSIQWITIANRDFVMVCDYAGLDHVYTRQRLSKLLQKEYQ